MSKISVNSPTFPILFAILCLLIISCQKEYPPFDEYQVVGFTPIDSVMSGVLFVSNDKLYALYDTVYSSRWSRIREYDISNPTRPVLLSEQEIESISESYIIEPEDSLVFMLHSDLLILNLNTKTTELLDVPNTYDIEYMDGFLFMSSYDGLVVWDISALPNYTEVFNESLYHAPGFVTREDTVLLEMYQDADYIFKFWNIRDPAQPQVIAQGVMPPQPFNVNSIEMLGNKVFSFRWNYAVYRFSYVSYDSLIYEDVLFKEYSPYYRLLDSLIYLSGYYANYFYVINASDFDAQQQVTVHGPYYNRILSIETFAEKVYVLVRNKGIEIYERREQ